MDGKSTYYLKEIIYITIAWIILTFFYVFIRFYDISEEQFLKIYRSDTQISKQWIFKISFLISLPLGFILGCLHTLVYPYFTRTKSFTFNVVLRFAVFSLLSLSIFYIFLSVTSDLNSAIKEEGVFVILKKEGFFSIIFYTILTENAVAILVLLRRNLGNNYFKNIIYNTYRFPKEEERVFMFIDMVDSTPTADKIGHLKYSRYIQDCFLDFSSILIGFDGEIYQFVGDEVVITWKTSKGFNYQKCMELYFKYIDYLKRKEKFYLKKHNARPMFRCAIHYGTVSTALVGDYKREMAYHGDVLNLCSRLQSACKENNTDMLISDSFYKKIDNCKEYDVNLVLLDDLKGIKKSISAYKVRLKTEST